MKRTIEIEDTLQERVDSAIEDVKQELLNYLEKNPDTDELPCLNNDLDYSGAIHEIVDGSVPIYTKEIEDTWYMHASELKGAYEDAGVGDNPREHDGMSAIYFYIQQEVNEWYRCNAQDIFDEWKEPRDEAMKRGEQAGEEDAERHNADPENYEPGNSSPYGVDSQAALYALWLEAYTEAFEAGLEGGPAQLPESICDDGSIAVQGKDNE